MKIEEALVEGAIPFVFKDGIHDLEESDEGKWVWTKKRFVITPQKGIERVFLRLLSEGVYADLVLRSDNLSDQKVVSLVQGWQGVSLDLSGMEGDIAVEVVSDADGSDGRELGVRISNIAVFEDHHEEMVDTSVWPKYVENSRLPALPFPAVFTSELCKSNHFKLPLYKFWCQVIKEPPKFHRKQWEFVYLLQAFFERGMMMPGKRGVGFGVGWEPLVSTFASRGCEVVATDLHEEDAVKDGWADTAQFVFDMAALNDRQICDEKVFKELVSYRHVNMNEVPDDLTGFDFCWSACAFEHLGDIQKGLDFVKRSLDCLNVGGVAIHTTEYNMSSDDDTMAEGPTVLFRKRDFEALAESIDTSKYVMEPLDLSEGDGFFDGHVDLPPYRLEPHLRLQIGQYRTTSIGVIITRVR